MPVPLQLRGFCDAVVPRQVAGAHEVAAGNSAQPLTPEHMPVRPQLVLASVGHSLLGSVLAASGRHRPSWPATLQRTQAPLQRSEQHLPSVQKPEAHSESSVHVPVCASLHCPLTQVKPATQSLGALHEVRHCPVALSQVKARAQVSLPASAQVPLPSQVSGRALMLVPAQLRLPHTVPLGCF